jgi:hypothetical protein
MYKNVVVFSLLKKNNTPPTSHKLIFSIIKISACRKKAQTFNKLFFPKQNLAHNL